MAGSVLSAENRRAALTKIEPQRPAAHSTATVVVRATFFANESLRVKKLPFGKVILTKTYIGTH
jgi:hypothetical protein